MEQPSSASSVCRSSPGHYLTRREQLPPRLRKRHGQDVKGLGVLVPRGTVRRVKVHLVDGTYELFRQHFGSANRRGDSPRVPGPFDATIGVLTSTLQLFEDGATHVAVASDHIIESFR